MDGPLVSMAPALGNVLGKALLFSTEQ